MQIIEEKIYRENKGDKDFNEKSGIREVRQAEIRAKQGCKGRHTLLGTDSHRSCMALQVSVYESREFHFLTLFTEISSERQRNL